MRRDEREGYFQNWKVAVLIGTNIKGKMIILNGTEEVLFILIMSRKKEGNDLDSSKCMIVGPKIVPIDLSEKEWENVVKINLKGAWLLYKNVGARTRDDGRGGAIIHISSALGLNRVQFRGSVPYSLSKAGLDSMTKVDFRAS